MTKNQKRSVGRPRAELKVIPRGKFTVKRAHELNPHIDGPVTVYKCIMRLVAARKLSKLRERLTHKGSGRPAWMFIRKAVKKAAKPAAPAPAAVDLTTPVSATSEPVTA